MDYSPYGSGGREPGFRNSGRPSDWLGTLQQPRSRFALDIRQQAGADHAMVVVKPLALDPVELGHQDAAGVDRTQRQGLETQEFAKAGALGGRSFQYWPARLLQIQ